MERGLRLRAEAEVRAARAQGRAWAEGPLVARVLRRPVEDGSPPAPNRYAVVAGKKVGGAVARNRAKRLVRESLRRLHPHLRPGHDIVVIVRGTLAELPNQAAAQAVLERALRRAGLLRGPGPAAGAAGPQSSGPAAS